MLTLEYLSTLNQEKYLEVVLKEIVKCKQDFEYVIKTYFTVPDAKSGQRLPFKMYPHQEIAIKRFQSFRYNLSMKSRQMGFSTITAAYVAAYMALNKNKIISCLDKKMSRSKKFLRLVRGFLDDARNRAPWLIPDYVKGEDNKEYFVLKNGCRIIAESNNEDACRGDTLNLLIIDECAAISKLDTIWAAAGVTLTKSGGSCIGISTPKGQSGWYFEKYTNAEEEGWNIIDAHWSAHPDFNRGMYCFTKEGDPEGRISEIKKMYNVEPISSTKFQEGVLHFYNGNWPDTTHPDDFRKYKTQETYKYITDGKIRSPWYDLESKKLGKELTKCELDCSFAGSGGEVLDTEVVRALSLKAKDIKPINPKLTGIWKSYKQYLRYNPKHQYILCSDVASGDGSDYSAFVVIDLNTLEVVATFKDQLSSNIYAKILKQVGEWFGSCLLAIESQAGESVLNELENHLEYQNIFESKLKKTDSNTGEKKKKKGFWQTNETRSLGGEKLEQKLNAGEFKIFGNEIIQELHTWIWKNGRRDHLAGKNDDLIMALTIASYIIFILNAAKDNKLAKAEKVKAIYGRDRQEFVHSSYKDIND